MERNELSTKVRSTVKKINTKHLVVMCAILLVGCAVVLNWLLYSDEPTSDENGLAINLKDVDFTDTLSKEAEEASGISKDYFAVASLDRQQARDEALEVLRAVAESDTALPEAIEAALNDMSKIGEAGHQVGKESTESGDDATHLPTKEQSAEVTGEGVQTNRSRGTGDGDHTTGGSNGCQNSDFCNDTGSPAFFFDGGGQMLVPPQTEKEVDHQHNRRNGVGREKTCGSCS